MTAEQVVVHDYPSPDNQKSRVASPEFFANSSAAKASSRLPDAGPYSVSIVASSCPNPWKQRSNLSESAYSPNSPRLLEVPLGPG